MAKSKIETELKDLIDTVMICCNPPDDCNNPVVLKAYMAGCFAQAEYASKALPKEYPQEFPK